MADALNNTAQGSSKPTVLRGGNKPIQINEGWELYANKTSPILVTGKIKLMLKFVILPKVTVSSEMYFKNTLLFKKHILLM